MKNNAFFLLLLFLSFIAKSSYSQDFWEIVTTPDTANLVSMTINSNGDIFLGSNGVYLSQDNGETWEFKGIYGKTILAIAIDSVGNIFAGSTFKIYKSADYGETWNVVYYDLTNIISLCPASPGLIFAGGQGPFGVIRSRDYGETWDTVFALFDNEGTNDFALASDGTVYAGTTDYLPQGGGVLQSSDSGDTWELIGLHNHYIKALALNSMGTLYAGSAGYIGGIFAKEQSSSEWTLLKGAVWVASVVINNSDDIYIGCQYDYYPGGVYYSIDYGNTWTQANSGLISNDVDMIFLSPDQYLYAIGDNTLYRSFNPTVSIDNLDINNTITVFPNPFINEITFQYTPEKYTNFSINIYSACGTLIESFMIEGKHKVDYRINGQNWSPGLYYYIIENGNRSYSGKIIKIK